MKKLDIRFIVLCLLMLVAIPGITIQIFSPINHPTISPLLYRGTLFFGTLVTLALFIIVNLRKMSRFKLVVLQNILMILSITTLFVFAILRLEIGTSGVLEARSMFDFHHRHEYQIYGDFIPLSLGIDLLIVTIGDRNSSIWKILGMLSILLGVMVCWFWLGGFRIPQSKDGVMLM